MTIHCDQADQDWRLMNSNYHQMVEVLMSIVRNMPSLRVDAPEWIPGKAIEEPKDVVNVKCEKHVNEDYVVNLKDENKEERWLKPKRVFSNKKGVKEKDGACSVNSHEILSYDDDESYEDKDSSSEMSSEESEINDRKDAKTVGLLKERVGILEDENKTMELRCERMAKHAKEREDEYVNKVETLLDRFLLSNVATRYYDHLNELEMKKVKFEEKEKNDIRDKKERHRKENEVLNETLLLSMLCLTMTEARFFETLFDDVMKDDANN